MAHSNLPDLVLEQPAPLKRRGYCPTEHNDHEHRLGEASVMLAFAMHLFAEGATEVTIYPDGQHGQQFDMRKWLSAQGFIFQKAHGSTSYGGYYTRERQTLRIYLRSGQGDVAATIGGKKIFAECKGGVINSTHSGVRSSLRSGLREAIGALMERDGVNERQIAVVPYSAETKIFAERAAKRAKKAGIEIALVTEYGGVKYIDVE